MNVKMMRKLALAGAVSVAMLAAACGEDGGTGGKPGNGVRPGWDDFGTAPFIPGAEPTPTIPEGGPIVITDLNTPGGLPAVSTGKCLGFTLVATEPDLYFSSATKVNVGPNLAVETLLLDGTHLRVGADATSHECFYTPLFGATGVWAVTVDIGGTVYDVASINVLPTKLLDVGRVEQDYVWSLDTVDDPEANVFETPYDVDVYRAEFYEIDEHHSFAHTEFFPTGATALLPGMEFRESSHPQMITSKGGYGLVFPKRGTNYVVVKDQLGQGGPGANYELQFITNTMPATAPSNEMCSTAPLITARTYYTSYDVLENDFDPQGNNGCRDSVYNTPINAPGNDAVWRVKVPAGKQLRVSSYDDHINNTTYLLPISTLTVGTNGCPTKPTNCVAAAGKFGGGNTDTMIYENGTDLEEEFFLIHDSATIMTAGVGSFMFDVEIWD